MRARCPRVLASRRSRVTSVFGELRDRLTTALRVQLARGASATDRLSDLEIEDARGMQRGLPGDTPMDRARARCPQQELDHGRCIKDDHRRPGTSE